MISVLGLVSASTCANPNGRLLTYFVVSDTNVLVSGADVASQSNAVVTYSGNGGWSASIPGASWIWDAYAVSAPNIPQTVYFTKEFYVPGIPVSAILDVAADNSVWVILNGQAGICDTPNGSFSSSLQKRCTVTNFVVPGMNMIQFTVLNIAGGSSYQGNPAGLLFKLSLQASVI